MRKAAAKGTKSGLPIGRPRVDAETEKAIQRLLRTTGINKTAATELQARPILRPDHHVHVAARQARSSAPVSRDRVTARMTTVAVIPRPRPCATDLIGDCVGVPPLEKLANYKKTMERCRVL